MNHSISRDVTTVTPGYKYTFAVCSLVTNTQQYEGMLASFLRNGFTTENSQFFHIDNAAGNQYDGYSGLHAFINACNSQYIILCHQDVELMEHGYDTLVALLAELDEKDPKWALAGNSGGVGFDRMPTCISHPYGLAEPQPDLPLPVDSLDENFIILKASAQISPSQDLTGFHFYGLDLCMQAKFKGFNAYVIGFLLHHYGAGTRDKRFYDGLHAVEEKHGKLMKPRWATTTCTQVRLTSNRLDLYSARVFRLGYYLWKHVVYLWKTRRAKKADGV